MHRVKLITSFVLTLAAAYAFSFAADMFFGRLFGVYPDTVWMPIATWFIITVILASLGSALSKAKAVMVAPWGVIGLVALAGAIFGSHVHSYVVAFVVLLVGGWRYWVSSHNRQVPAS